MVQWILFNRIISMDLHVRDCNSVEVDIVLQLFEFKARLIPRVRNWDCSKEPWGMVSWTTFGHYKLTDPYLSMTPFFSL